jgi:hypothetical protein
MPMGDAQTPLAQLPLQHSPELPHAVPVMVHAASPPMLPSVGAVPSVPASVPPLSLPQPAAQMPEHASTATGTRKKILFVMTATSRP